MGYTHYWQTPEDLDVNLWNNEFVPTVKKILETSEVELGDWAGEPGSKPMITQDAIVFNGVQPEDYETFNLSRKAEKFSFCKTQYRPYDKVCVAILVLAEQLFDNFSWSSDGDESDHKEGKQLLESVFTNT